MGIVREEGITKLWRGVAPAILRQWIYSGFRMGLYEHARDNIMTKDANGVHSLWQATIAGMTCGGFAQALASPADLVKVRFQMEGKRLLQVIYVLVYIWFHGRVYNYIQRIYLETNFPLQGYPAQYRGTFHAFTVIIKVWCHCFFCLICFHDTVRCIILTV